MTREGMAALRAVLLRKRDDDQGGYVGRRGGGWTFSGTALDVTAAELDALFNMAGIVPDEIQALGRCSDCVSAVSGRERGWDEPCASCKRPMMSNFVPVRDVVKEKR